MEAFTLTLLALVLLLAMCLFFCMSVQPDVEDPLARQPPAVRVPPMVETARGGTVDIIRPEARQMRRKHQVLAQNPVLAQNVAVARLMRLEEEGT